MIQAGDWTAPRAYCIRVHPDYYDLYPWSKRQMSTDRVPGYKDDDKLAMGCWAEHKDGSLILVESVEDTRVVFTVFELSMNPPVEYRSAMPIGDFGKKFSVDPSAMGGSKNKDTWTWHDKTPFDWDRVMDKGIRDGLRYPSAAAYKEVAERVVEAEAKHDSAAARVADDLGLKAETLRDASHMTTMVRDVVKGVAQGIMDALKGMRQ
jgi:hypothetical protein